MATSDDSSVSTRTPTAASAASARETLVDALGADDEKGERLRNGDAPYARRLLRSLEDSKSYVYALGAIMTVMSVVLPTAGLYEFFRRVDNLEPIELIGVIAAACAVAAIHMTIAAYVYVDWRTKRLCYRALADLPSDDTMAVDDA
ncbi:hypothetical protein [Longibacter sp.]|jgi:hypothetical protein|uniref:hypothetical protein n=1 Tax=Longibacter sp. TaxID=2045415 RepID=UPI003EBB7830